MKHAVRTGGVSVLNEQNLAAHECGMEGHSSVWCPFLRAKGLRLPGLLGEFQHPEKTPLSPWAVDEGGGKGQGISGFGARCWVLPEDGRRPPDKGLTGGGGGTRDLSRGWRPRGFRREDACLGMAPGDSGR